MQHSSPADAASQRAVAIVGGGLAGMAAALALAERGVRVSLFEAKRALGGRAGSFVDTKSGQSSDHCRHVSMGCCMNFADFCARTGIAAQFSRETRLQFIRPDGRSFPFSASKLLPAPLHLAPSLLGLRLITLRERWGLAWSVLALARENAASAQGENFFSWLVRRRTPAATIDGFWKPVLVSALGTELERVSLAAAQKVLVDGFLSHRGASDVLIPKLPLAELFDERAAERLSRLGVRIARSQPVRMVEPLGERQRLRFPSGDAADFDSVIAAVPWTRIGELVPSLASPPGESLVSSSIAAVHLAFDRPITPLPHAVLVGMLSQWLFAEPQTEGDVHRYQVVVSAAAELDALPREEGMARIVNELRQVFPAAQGAQLLHGKIVIQRDAVFAPAPNSHQIRPVAQTAQPGLFLAGDWTATGWPATMEGAVRSGYLAAEAVLAAWGRPERILQPDPPRAWLSRWICGR